MFHKQTHIHYTWERYCSESGVLLHISRDVDPDTVILARQGDYDWRTVQISCCRYHLDGKQEAIDLVDGAA